jgi:hypothetical protein
MLKGRSFHLPDPGALSRSFTHAAFSGTVKSETWDCQELFLQNLSPVTF